MKTYSALIIALLSIPTLTVPATVHADPPHFDFSADAGLEYDSNVNVQELDTTAGAADTARLLNARVDSRWEASDNLTLKAGFSHAAKDYRQYDNFSQRVNTLSADISYDFSGVNIGGSYHRAEADLAKDPFLELTQHSLYAGKLFNQRIFLRGAVNQREKHFTDAGDRNADGRGGDADVFFFFNNAKSFLSLGVSREREDAMTDIFDNDAVGFRGRWSNKFTLWGKPSQLQLAWRYLMRDYHAVDPNIGARREDVRRIAEASWEVSLNSIFSAIATVEHGKHQSNLDNADYDETVAAIQLKASF